MIIVDAAREFLGPFFAVYGPPGVFFALLLLGSFLAFRYVTTKWLDNKFQSELEKFKHSQNKEMEAYKHSFNALFDRAVRLHQSEFEALPEVWRKMFEAYHYANSVGSGLRKYTDVSRMPPDRIRDLLRKQNAEDFEIESILGSTNMPKAYQKFVDVNNLIEAGEKTRESRIYLMKYSIFIRPALERKFLQLDDLILDAMVEAEMRLQHEDLRLDFEKGRRLRTEGQPLLNEIKNEVQSYLWTAVEPRPD